MLVQPGFCRTCSETTLLVFPRGGLIIGCLVTKKSYDVKLYIAHHMLHNSIKLLHVYWILLYLINIHWLSVDFDWSRAGHAEGAILSCRMTILPSDAISTYKRAAALVVTCVCFTVHVEGDILSCRMIILLFDVKSAQKCRFALVVTCVCHLACRLK